MSISNPYLSSPLTQDIREYLAEEAQNKDLELLSEENILFVDKGVLVAVTEDSAGYGIRSIQAGIPKDNLLSVILREVQKSKIKTVVCFESFLDPSEFADTDSLKT